MNPFHFAKSSIYWIYMTILFLMGHYETLFFNRTKSAGLKKCYANQKGELSVLKLEKKIR